VEKRKRPVATTPTSAPGVPGICMDMGTCTGHVLWNLYQSWSCEDWMCGLGWAGATDAMPLFDATDAAANSAQQRCGYKTIRQRGLPEE